MHMAVFGTVFQCPSVVHRCHQPSHWMHRRALAAPEGLRHDVLKHQPLLPREGPSFVPRAATATEAPAQATEAATAPKEGVAHLRYVKGSADKVRRVLDQIRGRTYEEALMILEFLPYRACEGITATLISAASNARNNSGASKAKLYIAECFADQAGLLKRFQPVSKGRPYPIHKQLHHMTILVREK